MRVALLGRTRWLLNSGRLLAENGHDIALIVTARAERFYDTDERDFREFAHEQGAIFSEHLALNSEKGSTFLRDCQAQLGISVNWPSVLGQRACGSFSYGILNAHAGDLPRYRGNACPNWAILNGERRIGLCIHEMKPGSLDSGAVLHRDHMPLDDNTYIGDVYAWLDRRIPELFLDAVDGLQSGRITPQPQSTDPTMALRCYPRRPEDSLIDWTRSADDLARLVRASSEPFSGAFTFFNGEKLTIWRARPHSLPGLLCGIPGQVLEIFSTGEVMVLTTDGTLLLESVEINGRAREPPNEIIRSTRARLGSSPLAEIISLYKRIANLERFIERDTTTRKQ